KKYGPGVTDTEIKIGNTAPYSGPASSYSTAFKALAAYFAMINAEGGINRRKINFMSLDDGFSPPKTVEQTRRLVEQEGVLLDLSPLGVACNTAIRHYLNQKKVPQLFISGAAKFNDPKRYPWTMGWQPSFQSAGRAYAAYILREKPGGRIAVLFQNDDFGRDYLKGVRDGLATTTPIIILAAPYDPTTP